MEGKNVLYPIGWDAFGLPTENFAIKKKMKPQEVTKMNVANFRRQCQSLGFGFDWSREVDTTDPKYYKWTQWQFLKFYDSWYDEALDRARPISELSIPADCQDVEAYKNEHRLAFKAKTTINWCPKDKIGLANEEAQGGVCERCGTPVEKRVKEQWMIRITKYADRLIRDLDTVDYLEKIKAQQVNWIGKSEGAFVEFGPIRVFTTRPDTLFGVTYVVLAPEHELVSQWLKDGAVENVDEVRNYIEQTAKKSDTDRTEQREKTGVVLKGIRVTNPVNHESVPVWISDYVLANYGTGAVMAVPAHDERDFEFAKKYDLLIKQVVLTSGSVAGTVVDNGLAALKEVKDKEDVEAIKKAVDELSTSAQAVGTKLYQQEQQNKQEPPASAPNDGGSGEAKKDDNGPIEGEVVK
jgi:leucyl-tRNA synthetase